MSQADWNNILPNRNDFNEHISVCKYGEPVYDHNMCYQCLSEMNEQNAVEAHEKAEKEEE